MINNRYEYSRTPLEGLASKYISVPLSIIIDSELNVKATSVLAYLRVRCGLDDIIGFTVSDLVGWCGGKPDRRMDGSNEKYLGILDKLADRGYLTYLDKRSRSKYMRFKFNSNYYSEECSNNYSSVYLDEIEKIMQYKKKNEKGTSVTNVRIFLVFAYLRYRIRRRPNELKPEERTLDGIKERKLRYPEAYDGYINDIADEIGLSTKTVSKIIDILEEDLKLIVTDRAFRVRNEDGEFRTLPIIFANAYKRESSNLLLTEKDYSRNEIEAKAKKIKNYKINKDKRKAS